MSYRYRLQRVSTGFDGGGITFGFCPTDFSSASFARFSALATLLATSYSAGWFGEKLTYLAEGASGAVLIELASLVAFASRTSGRLLQLLLTTVAVAPCAVTRKVVMIL